jgi:hypothetical protein
MGAPVAAVLFCCSVYDRSLLEPEPNKVAPKDGVGWWSGPGDRGCFSAGVPEERDRPSPKGDKDVGPIYLAMTSMRLGSLNDKGEQDPNAWQSIGFDLDGRCTGSDTCEGADSPSSCKPTVPQIATDGQYCRDNTFGRLEYIANTIPETAKKYGLSDDAFNCALCVGDYNFLIRVTGYNGEPDDDHVRVDLYPSPGLERGPLPWNCATTDWRNHPCWTSDLPWTVEESSLEQKQPGPNLPNARIFDANAFVKEGYIVVFLPDDSLFWFPGYNALVTAFPMRLQKGRVSGKLARGNDGVWRITDGIIAGRARGRDLVKGFRLIGFCEKDSNYNLMTDFIDKNLDLLSDGRVDPDTTCDAMSIGLGFTALQAVAGKLATVEPLRECELRGGAADGGADAATDAR